MAASHASDSRRFIGKGPRSGRDCGVERLRARIVAIAGRRCGKNPALSGVCSRLRGADLPRIMPWRASIGPETLKIRHASMTLSVTHATEQASPLRGLLPLWVGVGIYALFLLAGNRLLIDPDTMWQITVGQWIIDHRAVPDNRRLFLHHARPALDLDAVAGAGALCQGLSPSSAGAARWCWRRQRSRRPSRCWRNS